MAWDVTYGKRSGAYLRAGQSELYVRREGGGWTWFVDGIRMGAADGEAVAKAASEAALRAMSRTHTGRMAAPTWEPDRAA
jgi:hypothetical protein